MAYQVVLEGSNDRQVFLFRNDDDAFNFASMAVEFGTYADFHYKTNENGETVRVDEEARPLAVTIRGVEE